MQPILYCDTSQMRADVGVLVEHSPNGTMTVLTEYGHLHVVHKHHIKAARRLYAEKGSRAHAYNNTRMRVLRNERAHAARMYARAIYTGNAYVRSYANDFWHTMRMLTAQHEPEIKY